MVPVVTVDFGKASWKAASEVLSRSCLHVSGGFLYVDSFLPMEISGLSIGDYWGRAVQVLESGCATDVCLKRN